jgi:Ni,Fe-hydrogenase maturation factor
MTHTSNPRSLLALARALYGLCPQARLVTIAGRNFELSDRLSPEAEKNAGLAVERIRELVE